MTAKHKNPSNGANTRKDQGQEENEKFFDFDKPFTDAPEKDSEEKGDRESQVSELESSLAELKEKHLRLLAEFDNYKKRTTRERVELLLTASKDVIINLLPVLDDFERAIRNENPAQGEIVNEGIRLIYNRFLNILQAQGLEAMDSTGETFDPDLHEAITEIPAPAPELKGKIMDTIEKGYMLNDKIIRHAKVVVGK